MAINNDLKIGLTLEAKDNATPKVRSMRDEMQRLAQARSQLGIRAEQQIQREIQRTQASYNRLARSGAVSSQELSRAYDAMTKKIAVLRTEMKREADQTVDNYRKMATERERLGIESEQTVQREIARTQEMYAEMANSSAMAANAQARSLGNVKTQAAGVRRELVATKREGGWGNKAIVAGSAVVGAYHHIAPEIKDSSEYSAELMRLSNRINYNLSTQDRIAFKTKIDDVVRKSLLKGGGTVGSITDGIEAMVSSKAFTFEQTAKLMPRLAMSATTSGAQTADLARLASSAKYYNIPYEKIANVLSVFVRMGQEGLGIDINELAHGMPSIMEGANSGGMRGYLGLRSVVPLAEVSAIGSNDKGQAMINAKNLVEDINGPNLEHAASHIKIHGRKIHWHKSIQQLMRQGIDPLEASHVIIEKAIDNDKEYQNLQRQYANTSNPDQKKRLSDMLQNTRGMIIGKFFRNQQARMSYITYDMHHDQVKALQNSMDQEYYGKVGNLAADKDNATMSQEALFKTQRAKSLALLDTNKALNPVNNVFGQVADAFTKLQQVVPGFTEALVVAQQALVGVGYGVAADVVLNRGAFTKATLTGAWKGAKSLPGRLANGTKGLTAGLTEGLRGSADYLGPTLLLGTSAYDAYKTYNNSSLTAGQKDEKYASISGGALGAWGGAEGGALLGSAVLPGVGTLVGGLLGGLLGYMGGSYAGDKLGQAAFNTPHVEVNVFVDGQQADAVKDIRVDNQNLRH